VDIVIAKVTPVHTTISPVNRSYLKTVVADLMITTYREVILILVEWMLRVDLITLP